MLPRPSSFLCIEFRFYFGVWHGYKPLHKIRELVEITCRILRGTLRMIRHIPYRKQGICSAVSKSRFSSRGA